MSYVQGHALGIVLNLSWPASSKVLPGVRPALFFLPRTDLRRAEIIRHRISGADVPWFLYAGKRAQHQSDVHEEP